jgi:hypothetical protein
MKQKLFCIALLLLSIEGFAQDVTKTFDEVKKVTVRNIGTIKKNNVIKGYFCFYEFDKIDHKNRLYKLNLMDENLNDLGTKQIEGPKNWELVGSGFDGNNFCFKFWDEKAKEFDVKVYDQQANEIASNTIDINYNYHSQKATTFTQSVSQDVNILENNGFVDYTFNDSNDAFIVNYYTTSIQKSWQQPYQPEGKSKLMMPTFLAGNSDMILTGVARIERGLYNMKTQHSVLGTDTKSGRVLFDLPTQFDGNFVVPINAIFEGAKILVIGLNYKSEKSFSSSPDGLAFLELDKTGKVLKTNFNTFEQSLGKYLPIENHQLSGGYYLYIHNIVRSNHNTNIVIAEKFKKEIDGAGAAMLALSLLARSASGGVVDLQLENMVAIEYDADGNVIQALEVPKAKGSTEKFPTYVGFLSPYLLAEFASVEGEMDYRYTSKNDDNSQLTFSFVDYDRLQTDAKKNTELWAD